MHYKINNTRFMLLIMIHDFMQVLNIHGEHYTKNSYFSRAHLIYYHLFIGETEINPRNYSEQRINMGNFVQITKNDVHIYAKFRYSTWYEFV
jgi:hypothetical protein